MNPSTFDLRGQSSSAFWGEAVVGIQVELFKISQWDGRRVTISRFPSRIRPIRGLTISWAMARDNHHLNVSLSVAYTLPLHRDKPKKEVLQPKPDAVVDDVVVPERKE